MKKLLVNIDIFCEFVIVEVEEVQKCNQQAASLGWLFNKTAPNIISAARNGCRETRIEKFPE